jgi:thiol-disulfide isomerase/thioredoxin
MEENIKELDDKTFDETLKSTDKLVIVEFYTNTCPNCLAIAPVYEELSKELSEDAVFAQLNAQKNMAIAARYGIMATPTFKFFCKNGPIGELVGAIHATVLRNTIKDLIRHRTECVLKSTRISYEMNGYG